MHSLGRGEGRAGLLSNSKYMHWLRDEAGLGSRLEWKPCRWAVSFLRPSEDRSPRVGGAVPLKLSLHYHASCVLNLFYGGLLTGWGGGKKHWKKGKRERKMGRDRERERDHHHYGQKDISRDMMQSTLNDIPRNPSPPPKKITRKKNVFLNPDFINTVWQNLKFMGTRVWKVKNFLRWVLHIPVGWLNTVTLENLGSLTLSLTVREWGPQVWGSAPVGLRGRGAHAWLRGGGAEGLTPITAIPGCEETSRKVRLNLRGK